MQATASFTCEVEDSALELRLRTDGDLVEVVVSGELDIATVAQLRSALNTALAGDHPDIVLDLSHLRFISVCGLRLLADAAQWTHTQGKTLVIVNPSRMTRRLLELGDVSVQLMVR